MASPIYAAETAANALTGTVLSASKTIGALLDASLDFEAQVTCYALSGGALAATTGVKFEFYHVYLGTTMTNVGGISAGATSMTVTSAAGMRVGGKLALWDSGNLKGEIVSITSVSGTTIGISATTYAYAQNANVYLIETSPSFTNTPAPSSGSYQLNTLYAKTIYLPTSKYFMLATNLDASNSWTVEGTVAFVSGVA